MQEQIKSLSIQKHELIEQLSFLKRQIEEQTRGLETLAASKTAMLEEMKIMEAEKQVVKQEVFGLLSELKDLINNK